MEGGEEDKRAQKEAMFGDLAAKLAAGPPKKPVGLVKAKTYEAEETARAEQTEQSAQRSAMAEMAKMAAAAQQKKE